MAGHRRLGRPIGDLPFTGTTRRPDTPARLLVPNLERVRAQLFHDRKGMPRHRMGRDAPKALSGREQIHRANGPSCPPMGHEPV